MITLLGHLNCVQIGLNSSERGIRRYTSITFECRIRFSGQWAPQLNWTIETTGVESRLHDSTRINNTYSNGFLTSTVTLDAHPNLNNIRLKCKLEFTSDRRSFAYPQTERINSTADNIPELPLVWKSPAIIVAVHSNVSYFEIQDDLSEERDSSKTSLIFILISVAVCVFVMLIVFVVGFLVVKRRKIGASKTKTSASNLPCHLLS